MAVSVLLFPRGGFAQLQSVQGDSVNATGPTDTRVSSTNAQTTVTFYYGKRQTFRSLGIPQRWANVLGNAHNPSGLSSLTYLDQTRHAHRGSMLLLSHYVDATFGDVQIVPAIPLPVQLVQFSGLVVGDNRVRLSWRTLGETSNYGFEVQRASAEPRTFTLIPGGFVTGHGTSIQAHEYAFTDSSIASGVYYYRLRQIDLDGSSTYHDPIRISLSDVTSAGEAKVPATFVMHQNFPNPFNPATSIRFELPVTSYVRLTVHDMLGRTVATLVDATTLAGPHEVTFEAAGLASGTYMYRMQIRPLDSAIGRDSRSGAGGFVDTKRMVIIK